ncbi:MAG: phage holin [Pygmaiobacter massiliensis]|nr:phage holin [Pygmaiobacter massiliensis]
MKINFLVRFKNPVFWAQLALAVLTPVLAYFGLTGPDITSWSLLTNTLLAAVKNPYVCLLVAVSVWNAINDPTTAGVGDSQQALSYQKPAQNL